MLDVASPPAAPANHRAPTARWIVAAGAALLLAYVGWMSVRARSDPRIPFLSSFDGTAWVVHDEPVELVVHGAGKVARGFRIRLDVGQPVGDIVLRVRALKRMNVLIDNRVIFAPPPAPDQWKAERRLPLGPHVPPGSHELMVLVENENGPAALWAKLEVAGRDVPLAWQSTVDGRSWVTARQATDRRPHPIARVLESPLAATKARGGLFAAIFVAAAAATFALQRGRFRPTASTWFRPDRVRWLVLGIWGVLACNNLFKLPSLAGFDSGGHLDYIFHIAKHHRLPLATDGWQMFQSPLNYLVSAPLWILFSGIFEAPTAATLLRIVPLACGLAQIELCFRALRHVFPARADIQILGTVVAGFLPMNFYLSQFVGNEPLAGVLGAAVFVQCVKFVAPGANHSLRHWPLVTGVLFGLALLAKVSAVLVGLPLLLALLWRAASADAPGAQRLARFGRTSAVVFGAAALVAGWYYLRNWIHLGRPFVGGWDLSRGITWWQDPGYRTAGEFLSFGAALVRPIYAGLESFWDGVYATFWSDSYLSSAVAFGSAPKWNFGFLSAGLLLALIPTAALLVGGVLTIRRVLVDGNPVWLIALACVGVYVMALVHHVLTLPYHCAVKAFYTVGAIPAYVMLAAAGFELLSRHIVGRMVMHGGVACWAVSVLVAYFARR